MVRFVSAGETRLDFSTNGHSSMVVIALDVNRSEAETIPPSTVLPNRRRLTAPFLH
jgi:hypothetical protein